ncbi:MAG: NAD-dependent DNA ligase LigA [Bacteroidales bacterium]
MDRKQAEARINELKAVLWENSRKYYVDNAPTMSDYDYDHLIYELADLEKQYPELITPDSPTQKVGSDLEGGRKHLHENAEPDIKKEFQQYPHRYPMLSLSNTYNIGEVEDFVNRAEKTLGSAFTYSCELKFDGTAICLTYVKGKLFRALTRGDGVIGDDVTENVRHISNIPTQLKGIGYPDELEIRGEILMPYHDFDRLNEERQENEDQPFANPRNAASGSLKLINPQEVGNRGLWCTLYHIPSQSVSFPTHKEALDAAASWGLPVSDKRRICHNIKEIEDYLNYWDIHRKFLPYPTDGIVIKINELTYQNVLGATSKFPRWAVAYKFKAEKALTILRSIDYQVGRTGAVTPVANLEPVQLSGSVIRRATLNNEDQMGLLDIRVGDWVYIEKGGEIIPKITSVDLSKRSPDSVKPVFPALCPDCGTPLVKAEGEAKYFCPNYDGCPTQIKGKLLHFLGRKAMNVVAGEATVDQLYNLNFVVTPADFYDLTMDKLLMLEGWKERSAKRFLASLEVSRNVPFERVLFALGIRYVGESTAKEIAGFFKNVDAIASATIDQLLEVEDVGDVIAKSVYDYFHVEKHILEIQRLKAAGLIFSTEHTTKILSSALEGKIVVISGTFSISREEMKSLIEMNGGKNSTSISGKTSFLLAGNKPGPEKIKKAETLGVKVIDETVFRSLIPEEGLNVSAPIGASDHENEPTLF